MNGYVAFQGNGFTQVQVSIDAETAAKSPWPHPIPRDHSPWGRCLLPKGTGSDVRIVPMLTFNIKTYFAASGITLGDRWVIEWQ